MDVASMYIKECGSFDMTLNISTNPRSRIQLADIPTSLSTWLAPMRGAPFTLWLGPEFGFVGEWGSDMVLPVPLESW